MQRDTTQANVTRRSQPRVCGALPSFAHETHLAVHRQLLALRFTRRAVRAMPTAICRLEVVDLVLEFDLLEPLKQSQLELVDQKPRHGAAVDSCPTV